MRWLFFGAVGTRWNSARLRWSHHAQWVDGHFFEGEVGKFAFRFLLIIELVKSLFCNNVYGFEPLFCNNVSVFGAVTMLQIMICNFVSVFAVLFCNNVSVFVLDTLLQIMFCNNVSVLAS